MKRFVSIISGLVMAASIAGCGNGGGNTTGTADMAVVSKDMATGGGQVDMSGMNGPCLNGMPGCTGDPCAKTTDCAKGNGPNQAAKCITTITDPNTMQTITYNGGFCTSTCRPARNDPNNNFLNPDCPGGNATCAGSGATGTCVAVCQSVSDCRDKYVCAFTNGTPNGDCEPIQASTCDPPKDPRPQMVNCMQNQVCVSYSPDSSYGQCADKCDPIAQNCPAAAQGMNGCIVDFNGTDGSGECINVEGGTEGSPCTFLNSCDAGLMCYNGKCRQYCRVSTNDGGAQFWDGGVPSTCPMGQTCQNIKEQGVTIKFTNAQTGICSP